MLITFAWFVYAVTESQSERVPPGESQTSAVITCMTDTTLFHVSRSVGGGGLGPGVHLPSVL